MSMGHLVVLALLGASFQSCEPALIAPPEAISGEDQASMARLVPADAVAVLGTPSLLDLDRALSSLGGDSTGRETPILQLLSRLTGWPGEEQLDLSRPMLVALRPLSGLNWPDPVFILPVSDTNDFSASPELTVFAHGRYVGMSRDPDYSPGDSPSTLATALPAGHLSARTRLDELMTPLRPMAQALVAMAAASQPTAVAGMDAAALFSAYVRILFDAFESMPSCEASLTVVDGHCVVEGAFDVSEGSALADIPPASCGALEEMVDWLDAEAPMQMVCAVDAAAFARIMAQRVLVQSDVWPQVPEDKLLEYLGTLQVLSARCGHVFASDGVFTEHGIESTYRFEAEDPNGLVEMITRLTREGYELMGGLDSHIETTSENGWSRTETAVDMNETIERTAVQGSANDVAVAGMVRGMYGGDGVIRVSARASAGRVLLHVGGEEQAGPGGSASVRNPLQGGHPAAPLLEGLERVEGFDTRYVLFMDYSQLMRAMVGLMAQLPSGPRPGLSAQRFNALGPVPVSAWLGGMATHWIFGLDCDVAGFIGLMDKLLKR